MIRVEQDWQVCPESNRVKDVGFDIVLSRAISGSDHVEAVLRGVGPRSRRERPNNEQQNDDLELNENQRR